MKAVVKARLASDPEIRLTKIDGKDVKVVNFTGFVFDPNSKADAKGHRPSIPVPLVAWGKNAEEVAEMKKGDALTFAGQAKGFRHVPGGPDSGNKEITQMGFIVSKIDKTGTLDKQMSAQLIDYQTGKIDQIYTVPERGQGTQKPQQSGPSIERGKTQEPEIE